jgi:hypothetical protein
MEPTWTHDIGRPDEAIGRTEVYEVTNLVNGPAHDGLDTIADRSQDSAATAAFARRAATIAGAGLAFAAVATRTTTVCRFALFDRHGARDAIAGCAGCAPDANDEQRRCEESSRDGSMNDR